MLNNHNKTIVDDIRTFIERWNLLYPVDVWWRNKYKVSFGSKKHRKANFISMMIEWEEEKMFEEIAKVEEKKRKKDDEIDLSDLHKSTKEGEVTYKTVEMDEEEIEKEYDDLNLSEFNDKEVANELSE